MFKQKQRITQLEKKNWKKKKKKKKEKQRKRSCQKKRWKKKGIKNKANEKKTKGKKNKKQKNENKTKQKQQKMDANMETCLQSYEFCPGHCCWTFKTTVDGWNSIKTSDRAIYLILDNIETKVFLPF